MISDDSAREANNNEADKTDNDDNALSAVGAGPNPAPETSTLVAKENAEITDEQLAALWDMAPASVRAQFGLPKRDVLH